MHIKGLDLPMDADQVLEQVIEPPEKQRVTAAIKSLEMVGALDSNQMTVRNESFLQRADYSLWPT